MVKYKYKINFYTNRSVERIYEALLFFKRHFFRLSINKCELILPQTLRHNYFKQPKNPSSLQKPKIYHHR